MHVSEDNVVFSPRYPYIAMQKLKLVVLLGTRVSVDNYFITKFGIKLL